MSTVQDSSINCRAYTNANSRVILLLNLVGIFCTLQLIWEQIFFPGKLTTLRVKQSSGSYCPFLTFQNDGLKSKGGMELLKSEKAISIHPLSKNKFLVLDSYGVLHVFSVLTTAVGSGGASEQYSENLHTRRLDYPMKVQLSAVFPSSSASELLF